jgi:hypothetical protein
MLSLSGTDLESVLKLYHLPHQLMMKYQHQHHSDNHRACIRQSFDMYVSINVYIVPLSSTLPGRLTHIEPTAVLIIIFTRGEWGGGGLSYIRMELG